ncbi:hypothetical protein LTR36_003981 [Oleoguttula mirabilis]|uniref:Glycosyltransferase family 25 protein n=1 Tax=Oleoguttula mirabilis TaxID=1507867 RepID=A0AAV9JHS1_9PEZI|nr:hypothetical protein LTR36_003981 [Oleoguttula mirabilis]
MPAARNARSPLTYALLALAIIVVIYYQPWYSATARDSTFSRNSRSIPANATLGFGALYVVSGPGSPRRQHLEEAAAVTELELRIPTQTAWTDEDVRNFRPADEAESRVLTGSVKAWLSHHLVLREFLASGEETALIFEDDIDWDVRLRTQQIPLAQQAAQSLSEASDLDTKQYPWGLPTDWDLFYVGHCGDYFGDVDKGIGVGYSHPDELANTRHVLYQDPTMLPRTDLHPFTASILTAFSIPDQTRVVHQSKWPLCTFGYAITRLAAERILNEIAPAHEDPSRNVIAYDAAILGGCRDGPLRCYTVTPELFHHMEGESLIADMEATERKIFRPPVDAAGLAQVKYRKETSNIACGFFDGSFYYNGDQERLSYLREEVGRKGRCLKAGQ